MKVLSDTFAPAQSADAERPWLGALHDWVVTVDHKRLGILYVVTALGFLVVGGEWFQMWQSKTWNGQEAAFRFIACIGLVLIFVNQPDGELA